jgi:hypothetical protein
VFFGGNRFSCVYSIISDYTDILELFRSQTDIQRLVICDKMMEQFNSCHHCPALVTYRLYWHFEWICLMWVVLSLKYGQSLLTAEHYFHPNLETKLKKGFRRYFKTPHPIKAHFYLPYNTWKVITQSGSRGPRTILFHRQIQNGYDVTWAAFQCILNNGVQSEITRIPITL